jgi:glutathione S-transferase
MKLIETATAPNPRRVRIFLAEKGLTVERENRDLGSLKTDEFSTLNPWQRVPILMLDDGTCISETVAICRYFEELNPTPALFGRDPVSKALVEMWQRRVELGLFAAVAHAFRHLHPSMKTMEVPQVAEWGEANKPKALEALTLLDRQLATHPFIAGATYSIADITALVAIDFMKPARIPRPGDTPHLDRWYEAVSSRPSSRA